MHTWLDSIADLPNQAQNMQSPHCSLLQQFGYAR